MHFISNGQISKRNWLLSGSASIATINNESEATLKYKQTNIQIAPSIGYFIKDRFAIGLRPSLIYGSNNIGNDETVFAIGPFMRYYLLNTEKQFNIFAEPSYSYGTFSKAKLKQNTFSIAAGSVVYFNTSVGLEFIIAYSSSKVVSYKGANNELRFGIGFQFSLEKDNIKN
jgi:hypothetical protein